MFVGTLEQEQSQRYLPCQAELYLRYHTRAILGRYDLNVCVRANEWKQQTKPDSILIVVVITVIAILPAKKRIIIMMRRIIMIGHRPCVRWIQSNLLSTAGKTRTFVTMNSDGDKGRDLGAGTNRKGKRFRLDPCYCS